MSHDIIITRDFDDKSIRTPPKEAWEPSILKNEFKA